MRDKNGGHGESPVVKMWYGKMAGRTIEEIIDTKPDYFIWMVEQFQDITVDQARYFKEKYGMELPPDVIAPSDTIPYEHTKDSPEGEYIDICKLYWQQQNKIEEL